MGAYRSTRAVPASLFLSALLAILSSSMGGEQPLVTMRSSPRHRSDYLDDTDTKNGPDPFFDDLVDKRQRERMNGKKEKPVSTRGTKRRLSYFVEVYENESRGLGRRWREPSRGRSSWTTRWSYKDGSAALPPAEILPPDDWYWVSEWKIDVSGQRDVGGWEYLKEGEEIAPSQGNLRRRRWVRSMEPKWQADQQSKQEDSLGLETLSEIIGIGAPALLIHEYEFEDSIGIGSDVDLDLDLLPVPGAHHRDTRSWVNLSAVGHAVAAVKGWWTDEFTFRGFGVAVVKPLFRGVLLRPDVGLGIRLPLTLHFRSWEKQKVLPSVSASFFVLWPPAVQVSQALSYPTEDLQEWATTMVKRIALPSTEALKNTQRKKAIQRLGISIGIRYSATYGFQWWLAPYFFLLPGVRVLWNLYESFAALMLRLQREQESSIESREGEESGEAMAWFVALQCWATAKTSGIGYSFNYSGSQLGGALILNFQPFFLPTYSRGGRIVGERSGVNDPVVGHEMLESGGATEVISESTRQEHESALVNEMDGRIGGMAEQPRPQDSISCAA